MRKISDNYANNENHINLNATICKHALNDDHDDKDNVKEKRKKAEQFQADHILNCIIGRKELNVAHGTTTTKKCCTLNRLNA